MALARTLSAALAVEFEGLLKACFVMISMPYNESGIVFRGALNVSYLGSENGISISRVPSVDLEFFQRSISLYSNQL